MKINPAFIWWQAGGNHEHVITVAIIWLAAMVDCRHIAITGMFENQSILKGPRNVRHAISRARRL
jgi:hypothetical protein